MLQRIENRLVKKTLNHYLTWWRMLLWSWKSGRHRLFVSEKQGLGIMKLKNFALHQIHSLNNVTRECNIEHT